jgi:nitronate monooxygenase
MKFTELVSIGVPIIQAPMAGVATAAMAAAVSNAGGLGSIGIGAANAGTARSMIAAFRERSAGPLHVNVFCHQPPKRNPVLEDGWLQHLKPHFERYAALPPSGLHEIYRSFLEDEEMLRTLLAEKPQVVSFHFGLPPLDRIRALRNAGIVLMASATSLAEAHTAAESGVAAVIGQGYEAGGHRGVFDPDARDDRLGTMVLTRLLVRELDIPVIAAGGIMDGAGIAAALRLGASAVQLGTAFIACPESDADAAYRQALAGEASRHTVMTRAISGRPARCLSNRLTALGVESPAGQIPAYPIAYDAAKALNAAARRKNEAGYGAHWAGQGAPMIRELPAADLLRALAHEARI